MKANTYNMFKNHQTVCRYHGDRAEPGCPIPETFLSPSMLVNRTRTLIISQAKYIIASTLPTTYQPIRRIIMCIKNTCKKDN